MGGPWGVCRMLHQGLVLGSVAVLNLMRHQAFLMQEYEMTDEMGNNLLLITSVSSTRHGSSRVA